MGRKYDSGENAKRACAIFDGVTVGSPGPKYKSLFEIFYPRRLTTHVLSEIMRPISDRAILTVQRHAGSWVVEHDGEYFGHSPDKEIAKAAAHKRARLMQDGGRACQVQVRGDVGYFSGVR